MNHMTSIRVGGIESAPPHPKRAQKILSFNFEIFVKIFFGLWPCKIEINSHLGGALETKLFGVRYRSTMIISPVGSTVVATSVVVATVVVAGVVAVIKKNNLFSTADNC